MTPTREFNYIKLAAVVLIVIVIANFFLLYSGVTGTRGFWMILIVIAVLAYFVLPKMRERYSQES